MLGILILGFTPASLVLLGDVETSGPNSRSEEIQISFMKSKHTHLLTPGNKAEETDWNSLGFWPVSCKRPTTCSGPCRTLALKQLLTRVKSAIVKEISRLREVGLASTLQLIWMGWSQLLPVLKGPVIWELSQPLTADLVLSQHMSLPSLVTLFSPSSSRIYHTLGHKTSLNKFKRIEIISSFFFSLWP